MKFPRLLEIGLIAVLVAGSGQILSGTTLLTRQPLAATGEQQQPDRKGWQAKSNPDGGFSEEVAEKIAQQVADGLEQHNVRHLLSAFDPDAMTGYVNFQNQVEAMFAAYDSFRVHFRLTQITSEGDTGVVVSEFELEETPPSQDAQPVRKTGQLRFEIRNGKKGWRIVEVKPRSFFS